MKANYSLRRRLVSWISLPVIGTILLILAISYAFIWHEIEEVYDSQLVHSAKTLLQITEHELLENEGFSLGEENSNLQHKYEQKLGFRIWLKDQLVAQSVNSKVLGDFEAPPGFSDAKLGDNEWRIFVFVDPDHQDKIEISENYEVRYELITQLMSAIAVPCLLFIPLVFFAIWFGVRKILQPVVSLSEDMDARQSTDLTRISLQNLPEEIAPLALALNGLFERIKESFKKEQEFTDNAAHELRTPLAAMKTQTQVLLKKAAGTPDCEEGLNNLEASIDRAAHIVEQLLLLARLQNDKLPRQKIDLSELILDVVDEVSSEAQLKNISVSTNVPSNVHIDAHEYSAALLVKNILQNAIKYTPRGGQCIVTLDHNGLLEITDTGPGLTTEEQSKIFDRFYRADKTGQTGSGLGLSISKWIAEAHSTQIFVKNNTPTGLIFSIQWP